MSTPLSMIAVEKSTKTEFDLIQIKISSKNKGKLTQDEVLQELIASYKMASKTKKPTKKQKTAEVPP
jgi:hypothetical protein